MGVQAASRDSETLAVSHSHNKDGVLALKRERSVHSNKHSLPALEKAGDSEADLFLCFRLLGKREDCAAVNTV